MSDMDFNKIATIEFNEEGNVTYKLHDNVGYPHYLAEEAHNKVQNLSEEIADTILEDMERRLKYLSEDTGLNIFNRYK